VDLADRFEQKVDRFGEHHLWVGSKKADGTGKMKIDGKTVTARRVAWELAKGPLPVHIEVKSCPHVKACVRLDHLSLNGGDDSAVQRTRMLQGAGSKREVRPGVWKLSVRAGSYSNGSPRRMNRNILTARPLLLVNSRSSSPKSAQRRHRQHATSGR